MEYIDYSRKNKNGRIKRRAKMYFMYLLMVWAAIEGVAVVWLGYSLNSPQVAIPATVSTIVLLFVVCRQEDGRRLWELKRVKGKTPKV